VKIKDIVHLLTYRYPTLKKDLRTARLKETPTKFISQTLKQSFFFAVLMTLLSFFILAKAELPKFLLILIFIGWVYLFFKFNFLKIKGKIQARKNEINKEVLFIGTYLLIKLYSGRPLLIALTETSKSRGLVARYIKEIVDDINTGSPIEKALENALLYSPSEKLKKILFQINNALKLGIDVTKPLESVLQEIEDEQEIEVKRYSKKLNSLVIFYMLLAIVLPSIGMVIFLVLSSFINIAITFGTMAVILFFIALIQVMFISMFESIRPNVDL